MYEISASFETAQPLTMIYWWRIATIIQHSMPITCKKLWTVQQMWNMFLIIMDQSSLLNSLVCHLDLLPYLMRLYLHFFFFFFEESMTWELIFTQFSEEQWIPEQCLFQCLLMESAKGQKQSYSNPIAVLQEQIF